MAACSGECPWSCRGCGPIAASPRPLGATFVRVLDEGRFWALIGEMRGDPTDAGRHRLYLALRRLPPSEIIAFQDRLAEVLHRLDLRQIAKQRWRDVSEPQWLPRVPGISSDGFLYARCAAVVGGRATVEAVLASPRAFRRTWDLDAQGLLYVADEAYQGAAGMPWPEDHVSPHDYETGSNVDGGWRRDGYPPGNPQ